MAPDDRSLLAAAQRPRLTAIARIVLRNEHDAEDIASEAIARAILAQVALDTLAAWLTTTTKRLIVDEVRTRDRRRGLMHRLGAYADAVAPDDLEPLLDEAEAQWLTTVVAKLPTRQREALQTLAESSDISEVATAMGISYKAAENLLSRARQSVRASARTTWAGIGVVVGWRWLRRSAVVTPAAGLILTAAIVLLVHRQEIPTIQSAPDLGHPGVTLAPPQADSLGLVARRARRYDGGSHRALPATDAPEPRHGRTVAKTPALGRPGDVIYVGSNAITVEPNPPGQPKNPVLAFYGCAQHPYVWVHPRGNYIGCWAAPDPSQYPADDQPTPLYDGVLPDLPLPPGAR